MQILNMKGILLFSIIILLSAFIITAENDCEVAAAPASEVIPGLISFYRKLAPQLMNQVGLTTNYVFSIASIFMCFLLLLPAMASNTFEQTAIMLGFPTNNTQQYEATQIGWSNVVLSLPETETRSDNLTSEFALANNMYPSTRFPLRKNYSDLALRRFDTICKNEDFVNDSPNATDEINRNVNDATRGVIPKMFDGPLGDDTALVAVNALYMKMSFLPRYFRESDTRLGNFHSTSSGIVQAWLMNAQHNMPYYENDKLQVVSVPFIDGNYSLLCGVPKSDCENDWSIFGVDEALKILNDLRTAYCNLTIPRFNIPYSQQINDPMQKSFNLSHVFGDDARFDNGLEQLNQRMKLNIVKHAANMEMNEYGVIAAAVTAAVVSTTAVMQPPPDIVQVNCNKPFVCYIINTFYKFPLFQVHVDNPKQ